MNTSASKDLNLPTISADEDSSSLFDYKTPAQEAAETAKLAEAVKLAEAAQYTDPFTGDYKAPTVNYPTAGDNLITGVLTPAASEPTQGAYLPSAPVASEPTSNTSNTAETGREYGTGAIPPGVSANQFAANYAAYNNSYAPSVPYQDTRFVEGKESPSTLMYGPNPDLVANADSYAQESGLEGVPPGISYNDFVRNYQDYGLGSTPVTAPVTAGDAEGVSVAPAPAPAPEAAPAPDVDPFRESISTQNVVYGPDGTEYGNPAIALAAGVTNYTMSPPVGVPITPIIRPLDPYAVDADYANIPAPRDRLGELSASYGGLGTAWQGVVGADSSPVLTSQGVAEKAFLGSPLGITTGNMEAAKNYSPPQDPAQQQQAAAARQAEATAAAARAEAQAVQDRSTAEASARAEAAARQQAEARAPAPSAPDSWGGENRGGRGGGEGGGGGGGGVATGGRNGDASGGGDRGTRGGFAYGGGIHGGSPNPYNLGSYSDGGRLLKGPGDGVSDSIPATIGKGRPARLADGEFVIPARIVSEIGNGSTDAGARKLYAMMDRIQASRRKTVGKGKVAKNTRAEKYLPR
jgi:hypothetical protein